MTKMQGGVVVSRLQRFYHAGEIVAVVSGLPDSISFSTKAGTAYEVGLDFSPSKDVRCLRISGRGFIDGFYPTNGVYYPAPNSDLEIRDLK
jgi:hypothetical protein